MKSFTGALIIFILGVATGTTYHEELSSTIDRLQGIKPQQVVLHNLNHSSELPKIELCFTPPNKHCGHLISQLIDRAQSSVYMQAYGLTHPEIIHSLIQAKQRGVEVKVLLDRSNLSQKHSKIKELQQSGIPTTIDVVQGIAHNKVIIIDELKTITGSFNFTVAADTRNAENVIIIEDKEIARDYLLNWMSRKPLNKSDMLDAQTHQ